MHRGAPRPANPVTCFPAGRQGGGASHQRGNAFPLPPGRLYGFRRQRQYKKWRRRRRTSPVGTVSQPIGRPFYGQAKGLLWLTWRSYAGPPQYYITPEGESMEPACKAKPITGRTLAAQGQRPGGWLNPHARKGVSTFGNTGKHRAGPDPDRVERRLDLHIHKGLDFPFCAIWHEIQSADSLTALARMQKSSRAICGSAAFD